MKEYFPFLIILFSFFFSDQMITKHHDFSFIASEIQLANSNVMCVVDAGLDRTLCENQIAYLGAIASGGDGNYSYNWSTLGAGQNHSVIVGNVDITYTVTVSDGLGCTATDEVLITYEVDDVPIINCPNNINQNNDVGLCSANITLPATTSSVDCAPLQLTGTNGIGLNYYGTYNGHYYYITDVNMNPSEIAGATTEMEAFAAVQATAAQFGGYIATIDDAAENTFLTNAGYYYGDLFIGLTDEQVETLFGWVGTCCGGGGSGYTNWNAGEPNSFGNEDYVALQISNGGGWYDVDLSQLNEAIIELPNIPNPTVVCNEVTGVFPVGTTTVTCTATDANGHTSTCSYDVNINDNEAPSVTCNALTFTTFGNESTINITASDINNNSTDNCTIQTMNVSPNSFDCNDAGVNVVTLTVTDESGNTATCNTTVTIPNVLYDMKK